MSASAEQFSNVVGSGVEGTDLRRWTLEVDEGRQRWVYHPADEVSDQGLAELQSVVDRYHLWMDTSEDVPLSNAPPSGPEEAMVRGFDFLSAIITEDGHWANDYGGPLFLMPGLIITAYITGTELGEPVKLEMIRYLTGKQTEEGGWGLHIESPTTMFGTALNYVSMRILGVPADDTRMARARAWMRENGSALSVPSWGKFWLAVLGVYEWDGLYPVPPELWLLPEWLPLHPSRWWFHCRIVYLPMGYLYGRKAVGPITPLIVALRNELYNAPYFSIDWPAARANICPADYYTPHTTLHRALFKSLAAYEAVHSTTLRQAALDIVLGDAHDETEI